MYMKEEHQKEIDKEEEFKDRQHSMVGKSQRLSNAGGIEEEKMRQVSNRSLSNQDGHGLYASPPVYNE